MLYLFACMTTEEANSQNQQPESVDLVEVLAEQLSGRFDSSEQSESDYSYYSIQLLGCAVDAPELGDTVLYIEQASLDSLSSPYRQRLYVLEQLSETEAVSTIYSLKNPARFIGLCSEEEVGYFTAGQVELREGCDVYLNYQDDGFTGATEIGTCSSDLNGASYATSIVTTSANKIESLDQGFDENGTQVWGAVDGPYLFIRQE